MPRAGSKRALKALALAIALVARLPASAHGAEDPDERWGLAIWGLSYHINRSVDYDEANVGIGLRYYFHRMVFVEADALRNSNHGIVLPVSAGLELKFAELGGPCNLYAVAAGTVAYYQNHRTERDYVRAGPVPGVTLGCGRVKVNGIIVLQRSHQPFNVIAASLTILLR